MSKYRIIEHGRTRYAIEKKGWIFWRTIKYVDYFDKTHVMDFNSIEEAKKWIDRDISFELYMKKEKEKPKASPIYYP